MREQHSSWLGLVTFCAVTTLAAGLSFGILFAGASVAFAVARSSHASDKQQGEAPPLSAPGFANRGVDAVTAQLSQPASANMKKTDDSGESTGQIFSGMVTDSRCGARHSMNSDKTSAECARSCVRDGSHYVLVDGEKKHVLEGDAVQLDKLAGQRAEILGTLEGDAIRVSAVGPR